MAKKKHECRVPGCGEEVVYKTAELCGACYQWMYYWRGRTPTDVMHRQWQIDRIAARLELVSRRERVVRLRRRA